ncbi:MAG: hypothetical protein K2G20_07480, partial [Lachnospiraceae bacterium]|nr:hypothetical protein [Lachnospiraceae bacterium]
MGDENIRNTGDESVVVNETGGAAEKKPEAVKEKKPKKEKQPKPKKVKEPKPKKVKEPKPKRVKEPKPKKEKAPKGEKAVTEEVKIQKVKTGKGFHLSLKAQLIIGFTLPVLLVVCIGIYAYNKAEKGMVNNYRATALQALQMTTDYMNYGFETVSSSALELYNDGDVINYTRNIFKDNQEGQAVRVGPCEQYHYQK